VSQINTASANRQPRLTNIYIDPMKFKSISLIVISIVVSLSCKDDYCQCVAPPVSISANLQGEWEWVKTVTPTSLITPASLGSGKKLQYVNDGNGSYLTFSQDDSLMMKLVKNPNGEIQDKNANTVMINFIPAGTIKFTVLADQLEFGELMINYSAKLDTVRHFYKRKIY
jgi:hypothetical protein